MVTPPFISERLEGGPFPELQWTAGPVGAILQLRVVSLTAPTAHPSPTREGITDPNGNLPGDSPASPQMGVSSCV